jgi:predicted transcriptional regulator of viral defense system
MKSIEEKIAPLFANKGILRSSELEAAGINRMRLSRLVQQGRLIRISRGLYALPEYLPGEHGELATVARRAPHALFCLLTALQIHELTTQAPFKVWIAIANKAHPPKLDYPPLHVVRFSQASLQEGVEKREVDGIEIHLTTPAKTVADCFKFRNKVGLDVAIEALREVIREKRATMDELWHFAILNRVGNVMRPYMEAVQ